MVRSGVEPALPPWACPLCAGGAVLLLHVPQRGAGLLQSSSSGAQALGEPRHARRCLLRLFIPGYAHCAFYASSVPRPRSGRPVTLLQGLPSSGL